MRSSFLFSLAMLFAGMVLGQKNLLYENLPVGRYGVGFKIITLTDPSRVTQPEYNYSGEKNKGDRSRKLSIHIWYPALPAPVKHSLTYGDYCYNSLLTATYGSISTGKKNERLNSSRSSVERWFGKISNEGWNKLTATPMMARGDAVPVKGKFPLLIGMLRPLSTTIVNELLASNGYTIAMISNEGAGTFSESALKDIPDMQFIINYFKDDKQVDINNIGSFGFSGSGFSQILFTMYDYRIKAVADLESGIYMDGLYQGFSASNYYDPLKLRVPFLHVFSRDLSKQEKFIGDFEQKTKYSKRYRVILNQPALHHWDFASEGYSSCIMLKMRGAEQDNIRQSFEIAAIYLLNFFNATLKTDKTASAFLSGKPVIPGIKPALWDISMLNPVIRSPDKDELEDIIRTRGIQTAVDIARTTLKNDSASNITQWFYLNQLGYEFLNERKYQEAIEIFKLNTDMHPADPNLFDSLAEGYELSGDTANMKKISSVVLDILNRKSSLTDSEKGLRGNSEKRLATLNSQP